MSQYKDSRPLNVHFDYDSLDIFCPTTLQDSVTIGGPLTLNPAYPFTQNTWPRNIIWSFTGQVVPAGANTPLNFAAPVIVQNSFIDTPTFPLPFNNFFNIVGNTLVFTPAGQGVYAIRFRVRLTNPIGVTSNYKIYFKSQIPPGAVAIESTGEALVGLGANPPTSNFEFFTVRFCQNNEILSFDAWALDGPNTWNNFLSVIKFG